MIRSNEQGWTPLSIPDGRRGIWIRVTKDEVALCAGREGDDTLVVFRRGDTVGAAHIALAEDVLDTFRCALLTAGSDIELRLQRGEEVELDHRNTDG